MPEEKSLTKIITYIRTNTNVKTQLQIDSETALQEMGNIYSTVGYVIESIATKCRTHGKINLINAMPEDLRQSFSEALYLIEQIWPNMSEVEFPNMPDEAIVEEPVSPDEPVGD